MFRAPDFSTYAFFLWGYLKAHVYPSKLWTLRIGHDIALLKDSTTYYYYFHKQLNYIWKSTKKSLRKNKCSLIIKKWRYPFFGNLYDLHLIQSVHEQKWDDQTQLIQLEATMKGIAIKK